METSKKKIRQFAFLNPRLIKTEEGFENMDRESLILCLINLNQTVKQAHAVLDKFNVIKERNFNLSLAQRIINLENSNEQRINRIERIEMREGGRFLL